MTPITTDARGQARSDHEHVRDHVNRRGVRAWATSMAHRSHDVRSDSAEDASAYVEAYVAEWWHVECASRVTVGSFWYLRYHGRWCVTAVSDVAVTLTREHGADSYEVQMRDFLAPGSNWFQPEPMSAPTKHVRTTADYMSDGERAAMRDAGRGHLCR